MSHQSNSIFGRLANQFHNSDSLFFHSRLSKAVIHQACKSLGHRFRERVYKEQTKVSGVNGTGLR